MILFADFVVFVHKLLFIIRSLYLTLLGHIMGFTDFACLYVHLSHTRIKLRNEKVQKTKLLLVC